MDLVVETFAQAALVGEGEAARWEMALWPNADGQGDATFWQIEAKGRRSAHTWTVVVPDQESIALSDLLALDAPGWEAEWPTQRQFIDDQLDERVPAAIEGELADQVASAQQAIVTAGADAAEAVRQQEAASAQAVQQQEAASELLLQQQETAGVEALVEEGAYQVGLVGDAGDAQVERVTSAIPTASEAEAEAGDGTEPRLWTPDRVRTAVRSHAPRELPGPRSGYWMSTPADTTTGQGHSVGLIRIGPYPVADDVTIDAFNAQILNGTAGATVILVLYGSTADGLPGDLIAQTAALDASAAANIVANVAPVYLPAGLYWVGALLLGAEVSFRARAHTSYNNGYIWTGSTVGAQTNQHSGYGLTVDSAPPAVWPSPPDSARFIPIVRLRAA